MYMKVCDVLQYLVQHPIQMQKKINNSDNKNLMHVLNENLLARTVVVELKSRQAAETIFIKPQL